MDCPVKSRGLAGTLSPSITDSLSAQKKSGKGVEFPKFPAKLESSRCAKGEGVTKNETEAIKWIRKAAEQGHKSAIQMLHPQPTRMPYLPVQTYSPPSALQLPNNMGRTNSPTSDQYQYIPQTCPGCNGRGYGDFSCAGCEGTGRDHMNTRCPFCNGTGFWKCGVCNGTGKK